MAEVFTKGGEDELLVEATQPSVVTKLSRQQLQASLDDAKARLLGAEQEVTKLKKLLAKCDELGIK